MTWIQEVDLHSSEGVPLLVRVGVPLLVRYKSTVDVTVSPTLIVHGSVLGVTATGDKLSVDVSETN